MKMTSKTLKKTLVCLAAALLCSSCATRRSMIYLQDMDETVDYPVTQKYEMKIQRDDRREQPAGKQGTVLHR